MQSSRIESTEKVQAIYERVRGSGHVLLTDISGREDDVGKGYIFLDLGELLAHSV